MLTVPIPTQAWDPVSWARKQNWLAYNPAGTITDIPGAGVLPTRRIPCWPQPASHATFVPYWGKQPRDMGMEGLGRSVFDQVADMVNREVGHEAETAVKKAVIRYVVPPMVLAVGLSLIAIGVALKADRRKANRRRLHRRRR